MLWAILFLNQKRMIHSYAVPDVSNDGLQWPSRTHLLPSSIGINAMLCTYPYIVSKLDQNQNSIYESKELSKHE